MGAEPPVDLFIPSYFDCKKPRRTVNAFQMLTEFLTGVIALN
jgi:hypothetical protein